MLIRIIFSLSLWLLAEVGVAQRIDRAALNAELPTAVTASRKSVVAVVRRRKSSESVTADAKRFVPHEYGTGVAIGPDGLILTNYHLLGDVDNSTYGVWHESNFYRATVIAADPWTDLAILKATNASIPPITIRVVTLSDDKGGQDRLKADQSAFALGTHSKIARSGNASATPCNIEQLSQSLNAPPERSTTIYKYGGLLQIGPSIRQVPSGGPLLDHQGRMIGLVTSAKALEGYHANTHYAIPMTPEITRVIESLTTGREVDFGFLGIDPDPELASTDVGGIGVHAQRVLQRTPAASGGILSGDIVTHVNGAALQSINDFLFRISIAHAGDRVKLTVVRTDPILRRNRILEREVELSKRFVANTRPVVSTIGRFGWRGVEVDHYTSTPLRSALLEPAPEFCVRVKTVERDSPAWQAGLRANHLITSAGGVTVSAPAEFEAAVTSAEGAIELEVASRGTVVIEAASQN